MTSATITRPGGTTTAGGAAGDGTTTGTTTPAVERLRPELLITGSVSPHRPGATERAAAGGGAAEVQALLDRLAGLPEGHPGRSALRARSIEAGLPLARRLAAAYRGRGEPFDDLCQVAAVALVRAVDDYDPTRRVAFTSYAVPTIVGALKRHFRDSTWRMQVPRKIKDLAVNVAPATAMLAQQLRRSPTLHELAVHLDASDHDVAVAVNAWLAHSPGSLDTIPAAGAEEKRPLVETVGAVDAGFEKVTNRHSLRPLLATLTVRQRRILAMRFFDDMTQAEIADQIGVSQMQVSRLLVKTLAQLRAGMLAEPDVSGTRAAHPSRVQ